MGKLAITTQNVVPNGTIEKQFVGVFIAK